MKPLCKKVVSMDFGFKIIGDKVNLSKSIFENCARS